MSERRRLDQEIEARGLLPSRARARDAVLRGTVQVNGQPARKPNQPVLPTDHITLDDPAASYVSRAALKLIAGLDAGGIAVAGRYCLDLGASTGGFTQVLLERGARHVVAVDVGHDQLHPTLAADHRVTSLEGLNGRELTAEHVTEPVELLVSDLSFVSVLKVIEPALALCAPGAFAVVLVKPQFEVGREFIGKGGIVTDSAAIAAAVARVVDRFAALGWRQLAAVPSPIAGGDGNRETVTVFRQGDERGRD